MINKYLLCIVILIFSFQSCKDSLNEPNSNSSLIYLNGKIQNYNLADNVTLKLERDFRFTQTGEVDSVIVIDSTLINSDGSFSFKLNTPPEILLQPHNGLGCAGLTFSNDAIRTYPHNTFRLYKNNEQVGYIYCALKPYGNDYYVGEYFTTLMYSEDKLTVNGDCIGQSGNHINIDKTKLNLEKGWNFVIKTITEYTDSTLIQETIVDNNFKGNWIIKISN